MFEAWQAWYLLTVTVPIALRTFFISRSFQAMIIAQLSDLHVDRSGRNAERLFCAIQQAQAMVPWPDAALLTGDLTDSGSPEEYRLLTNALSALKIPYFPVPGNHDDRENFRKAFYHESFIPNQDSINYVIETFPVRLIGLDSLEPGRVGGKLDAKQLSWLDEQLAQRPDAPTLLFMHHPPFKSGIIEMDEHGFSGNEALYEVVSRHRQIKRVVCGHLHRAVQVCWAGTLACSAPGIAWQYALDLQGARPLSPTSEQPGFSLHVWSGNQMITHTRLLEISSKR